MFKYWGTGDLVRDDETFFGIVWSASGNLNTARDFLAGAGTQNAALSFGGDTGSVSAVTEKFDGSAWSTNAGWNLNTARRELMGTGIQSAALSAGGYIAAGSAVTEKFDGSTWTATGSLSGIKFGSAGAGTQSAGLIFGGYNAGQIAVTEKFNGSTWSTIGSYDLNTARDHLAGAGIQNAALSFGGAEPSISAVTEKFDGSTWTATVSLNTARYELAGAGSQNAALSFGGNTGSISAVTEKFNGSSWVTVSSLNTGRKRLAGAGTKTAALSFGGNTGTVSAVTEKFDDYTINYTHVEGLSVNDRRIVKDLSRVSQNIFENQKEIYEYISTKVKNTDQGNVILRNGGVGEFNFVDTTDLVGLEYVTTYEITPFTAVANTSDFLSGKFFNIYDGDNNQYYVWYDSDNGGFDPGIAHPEITTFTVSWATDPDSIGGEYFNIYSTTTTYYVWYDVDNTDVDPAPGGTGIEVDISIGDSEIDVALKTANAISAYNGGGGAGDVFTATANSTTFTVTNTVAGAVTDADTSNIDFAAPTIDQQGLDIASGAAGTGIRIDINNNDTADTVKDNTVTQFNAATDLMDASSTGVGTFQITTNTPGNPTDATDGSRATTFTIGTITQPTVSYKYFVRTEPGILYLNDTLLVVNPQTRLAERQLEKIFNLKTYLAAPESVTINYSETYDNYQARISIYSSAGVLTNYDFVNGATWGDHSTGSYDTGIELLHAIWNHSKFHVALSGTLAQDLLKLTLEPTIELTDGTSITRYIGYDSNFDFVESAASLNSASGYDFYTITYSSGSGSISLDSAETDDRTFFQNDNDFRQNIYLNVPNTISGSDSGTENIGSLDFTKVTNQDAVITVLRQNAGSDDSVSIGWDESQGAFTALGNALNTTSSGTVFPTTFLYLGKHFYKTDVSTFYIYNGTAWVSI